MATFNWNWRNFLKDLARFIVAALSGALGGGLV